MAAPVVVAGFSERALYKMVRVGIYLGGEAMTSQGLSFDTIFRL